MNEPREPIRAFVEHPRYWCLARVAWPAERPWCASYTAAPGEILIIEKASASEAAAAALAECEKLD